MTHAQTVYAVLIAAFALVNLPFFYHHFSKGKTVEPSTEAQAIITALTNATTALTNAAAAFTAATSASAQAAADLAAIQTAATALSTEVNTLVAGLPAS